ncbi:MAG: hypothetical protein V4685_04300 [Bacteroidota bacterium]
MVRHANRLPVIKNIQKGIQVVLVLIAAAILYINYESIIRFLNTFNFITDNEKYYCCFSSSGFICFL